MDFAQLTNQPASSSRNLSPIYANGSRETKLYIIINSETPIYMKVPIPPESLTLAQIKSLLTLQYNSYKYYFKSHDPEFGDVKEEISDNSSKLPYDYDKIVVWVVSDNPNARDALFTMSTPSPKPRTNPSVQSNSSNPNGEIYLGQHPRGTHSLPRSITPRSLYYPNQFDTLSPTSRSVYDSVTDLIPMRSLDSTSLHCLKDHIRTIYSALKVNSDSLDIRDREWLKMVVKDAFLGSSLVKWLSANVYGFGNKKDIKRFANQMLSLGFIRDPMGSGTFSEKCYYTLS